MCTGEFPDTPTIQKMGKPGSKLKVKAIEKMFNDKGNKDDEKYLLAPKLVTQVLAIIDKPFMEKLCIDGQPIDRFGGRDNSFTDTLDDYNFEVLSKLN